MDVISEMEERAARIESLLREYLPREEGYQRTVISAMNYSALAGGKRLRPMLMEASYELFGGRSAAIRPFMAAIEMIHTYSLIHDDLPAMDNDEYRRGKKTCHAVYGEAMGILAGDALLNYAFETALGAFELEPDNRRIGRALLVLAGKAGIYGMIGGQVADVESSNCAYAPTDNGRTSCADEREAAADLMSREKLEFIYRLKTGALLEASLMIGAILGGADESLVRKMEQAGEKLGMAFQIQDDILDLTSTLDVLGKPIGSDEKNNKTTYVTYVGLERAAEEVKRLSVEAAEILEEVSPGQTFLRELFLYLIHREK